MKRGTPFQNHWRGAAQKRGRTSELGHRSLTRDSSTAIILAELLTWQLHKQSQAECIAVWGVMRNCELIVLLLTALACGPECWSLSKDGGTESHDTQEHRLGPDHELEEGKCNVFETGGNLLPESKPNEQLDHGGGPGEDGGEKVFEIIEKPVHQSAFSFAASTVTHMFSKATNKIYNGASNVASDFAEKAKSKIYNGATNVASDFAEKVREVFHEEMYGFLESLFGKVGDMIYSPGE